ncbi:glutathione S-transferase C-terminal-like protein [Suillus clintonianus]|uniref:glutathione S-transferase C-terminal-like protein n=1 Tax=Suillus clintonianus TaxID=1904413 RepID=UPI001B886D1C|nr:glutathione S-transferase C-terminal-like protein [Suillus clintonianus]KAG2128726.1 glutathione S-transferase C-terminal-like protein [Suillus clintonianus]
MAPIGSLWGFPRQRQTKYILSAAAIAGLEVDLPPFEFGVTNKSPEFIDKFPFAKVPAFEDKDGFTLVEGASIARYVASLAPESGLLGRSIKDAALVDQWIHFAEHEINAFTNLIWMLVDRFAPEKAYSESIHKSVFERQERSIKFLEQHIDLHEFIVCDEITLADIVLAGVLQRAARITLGAAERALYSKVFAYYEKVVADPRIKDIFGEADFVEVPVAPKKDE